MTAEQLQALRAERWRQKSNPLLTLEDAATWLNTVGLCLFLPRRSQFLASAPSFVEACSGDPSETPAAAAIENARGLMIRLMEDGAVLPLNLFGTLSDQPDFLVSREAFPYIFSLRGGRNWKAAPPKASPLVAEIWKTLEKGASLEATEIQASLGREVTEAAVLRGLMELWSALRVTPVYAGSGAANGAAKEPTRWELTQARFSDTMNAANKIAQTTALSALVSLYLESVVSASADEVETFLSPLTSRSKVREVVNGLAATRQVSLIPVGMQTLFHITGSLPEFAEPEPAPALPETPPRPRFERERPFRETGGPERRPSFTRDRPRQDRPRTGPRPERFAAGSARAAGRGGAGRGGAGRGSERPLREGTDSRGNYPPRRKQFGANAGGAPRPRTGGDRPYRKPPVLRPEDGERPSFTRRPFEKRPFDKPARPYAGRGAGGDRPPRRHSSPRTSERTSSGQLRPGAGRSSFRAGGGKFPPKKFGPPKSGPKNFGPKNLGSDRPRPWKGADASTSRPLRPAGSGDRPFRPRREEASGGPRSQRGSGPYGTGKVRDAEKRPFFRDKPGKPGGKTAERSGPPRGKGDWKPKPSSGGFSKSGKPAYGKPKFGEAKPGGAKFGGKKSGGSKPSGFKPGNKSGYKSKPKPGGAQPPFRKRKDEGKKSSE
ncbi:MAG TPA: hypothetical protein VHT28_13405 [Silvibacterium sp.]|nr:hypothetical protein [Silvibacterium sp.]